MIITPSTSERVMSEFWQILKQGTLGRSRNYNNLKAYFIFTESLQVGDRPTKLKLRATITVDT